MNKKKAGIILFCVAIVVGLVIYRIQTNNKSEEKNEPKKEKKSSTVKAIIIQPKYFAENLTLTGTMEPNEQIDLQSEIAGLVQSIHFNEGSYVSRGQTLVKLNDVELQAQLSQARTKLTLAGENQRRAKLLLEKEAISQEEFETATAEYRTTQSQIQIIQAQLSKTVIRAPFSGKIGIRNIAKGSYITPSTIIAKLVNIDQIKISFTIPEKYAHMVKINRGIQFNITGVNQEFSARIFAIDPIVDMETRTLFVKAIANNQSQFLVPGTFANVNFPLESEENALMVPAEALIPIQDGKKVFLYKNGKAKESIVQIGGRNDKEVVIVSGVEKGDTILTSGMMTLKNDAPVKVKMQ